MMPDAEIEPRRASQDDLVADIERTREELARTIDAISDRLNPANAARRGVDRVRQRVARVDPVVAGGVAVVAVGAAVAWLMLRRRQR